MELNYIDIGCNLMGKQFKDDREQVVEQSLADGVGLIITGTDPSSNRAGGGLCGPQRPGTALVYLWNAPA